MLPNLSYQKGTDTQSLQVLADCNEARLLDVFLFS
jgi:hypothetical protein